MDCLYCKNTRDIYVKGIEDTTEFRIITRKCSRCGKVWKDYEGNIDAANPIVSIQRQKNLLTD